LLTASSVRRLKSPPMGNARHAPRDSSAAGRPDWPPQNSIG
jgi:hypothetical protein